MAEIVRLKNKETGAETRVGRAWLNRWPDDFKDWEEISDKPKSPLVVTEDLTTSAEADEVTKTASADPKKTGGEKKKETTNGA